MGDWQALRFEPSASTQGLAGSGTAWLCEAWQGRGTDGRMVFGEVRLLAAHARPGTALRGNAWLGEAGNGPTVFGGVRLLTVHAGRGIAGQSIAGRGTAL